MKLDYIKDTTGNNYIGINIYVDRVTPYLNKLKNIIRDDYDTYVQNQQNRDRGHYHITVINVMDYNRISKEIGIDKFINSLEHDFSQEFDDVKFMGLGTAEKNGNRTYFIVVKSEQLQELRKKYDLPEQDFHITLGFKWKDVFGVRKNEVIKENDPFLKLLSNLYYNNHETFEFIKEIDNFDYDLNKDITPVEIKDSNATFRIDSNYFTVSLMDDGNLRIVAKWQDDKNLPIISNTIISKKFKDI